MVQNGSTVFQMYHCYITFGLEIMHIHLDPVFDVDEDDASTTDPYRVVAPVYIV